MVTWEGSLSDYESWLQRQERSRVGRMMEGWRPPRPPFTGVRVYVHRDTKNRVVKDGQVWCTVHNVPLREYADKRGTIQRKCRPCNNEYMVEYKRRARGQAERKP